MAFITVVNGTTQPVFAIDVANGSVAASSTTTGVPVNLAGPKLDFFSATANANIAGEQGVQEYVANVINAIQQTSTVAFYQVNDTQLSFGIYPSGAFANSTVFLAAANITYTGFQLNSAANVGFKLATS